MHLHFEEIGQTISEDVPTNGEKYAAPTSYSDLDIGPLLQEQGETLKFLPPFIPMINSGEYYSLISIDLIVI